MCNRYELYKSELSPDLISPKLLYCHLFRGSSLYKKGFELESRYVRNYEIEYFTSNGGGMWINNLYYDVKKGDVIFRKPGYFTQAVMPYDCYCIFFSFTDDSKFSPANFKISGATEFETIYSNNIIDSIPTHFHPMDGSKYSSLFDFVLSNFINPSSCSTLLIKSYILQIVSQVYQDAINPLAQSDYIDKSNLNSIKKAIEYIHYHIDEELTLNILSKEAKLSPSHFHKLFSKTVGITPNEYIVKARVEKSKEMLIKTGFTISEIAYKCGFSSLSYFSYIYKKRTGLSPLEFRNKHDLYRTK